MKYDEHILTSALAVVRAGRGLASAIPVDNTAKEVPSDKSYEPACINVWAEMVKATDDMVRAAG